MSRAINKVAVIGAGVMGAAIAAHVANAGVPVVLLDRTTQEGDDRSAIAKGALAKLVKSDPAAFTHRRNAKLVTPGNLDDDLPLLADCDWIIEAIIEDLAIKRDLYGRIEAMRKDGSIVSSNTSTIRHVALTEGLPKRFRRDFAITHFFNPPRYMRLLEIVGGSETCDEALAALRHFGDHRLGKAVIDAKDTPGFIANRLGILWIASATNNAIDCGLTVEEADAVAGRPMGFPKTGVFGLLDLVGLDIGPHVALSMLDALPPDDRYHQLYRPSALLEKMIADGYTGRKGKGGYYRLNRSGGGKVKEAIDLTSGTYRPQMTPQLASLAAGKSSLRALVEHPDRGGQYAWKMLSETLAYAASLLPEIAQSVVQVDEAMRTGYAWKWGPFEMIDQLGAAWFAERLRQDGQPVPALLERVDNDGFYRVHDGVRQYFDLDGTYHPLPRPEGVLLLADIKQRTQRLIGNGSASLWDIGDGVLCLEFHTKMNSLNPAVFQVLAETITLIPQSDTYRALVIYNEGSNFSVGANIGMALFAANIGVWSDLEKLVQQGQETYRALKAAPFPVVGAPAGMALGGGCEILLHCDAIQAHVETYMGLVEVGVGIIPGWGGCKEMLYRWCHNPRHPRGPMPGPAKVFETISTATVAKSAEQAKDYLFLRLEDGITMNRDRLLSDAKARALHLIKDYAPPPAEALVLPGQSGYAAFAMAVDDFRRAGKATPHDVTVSKALARVLSGGDTDITETVDEDTLLALEREAFMGLLKTPLTLARIEHMLETGKPLRN